MSQKIHGKRQLCNYNFQKISVFALYWQNTVSPRILTVTRHKVCQLRHLDVCTVKSNKFSVISIIKLVNMVNKIYGKRLYHSWLHENLANIRFKIMKKTYLIESFFNKGTD